MNTDKVFVHGIEYVPKVVVPEPAKVGRWKPEIGDIFWYVSSDGRYAFRESYSNNNNSNEHMCLYGNMYQTEELALRARDKQLLMVELQDCADKCNAVRAMESDGNRYHLYSPVKGSWSVCVTRHPVQGSVCFDSYIDTKEAIEHFGSRLDLLLTK